MTEVIKNKYVKTVGYLLIYVSSVIFTVVLRNNYYNNAIDNRLYLEINKISDGFQFRQILASLFLFIVGYWVVAVMLPYIPKISKMLFSMPMGIVIWGLSSVIILVLRIPYTRITSFGGFAIFVSVLLFAHRSGFQTVRCTELIEALIVATIFSNLFSTGYPRYTMTSDTHYCVYIYGRLIASGGKLSTDTVGNLIETTGIMPALMACFAVFCGFETIQVMHYILMTSLMTGILVYLYKVFLDRFISKWRSITLAVFLMATAISPLFLMYDLIISHSWIMVYMFFVATTAEEYSRIEDKSVRSSVICLLSLFLAWMSLCRVEAIVTVIFMIVCMSYLGLSRKEITLCSLPAIILTAIFHTENQIMIAGDSSELPYGSVFITKSILLMMAAVILLMIAYLLLYEKAWIKYMRQNMPIILLLLLILTAIVFCIKDFGKAGNNFQAIFYNLSSINERWYYFPFLIVIMLVLIIRNKWEYGYWDMLVLGMILVFFCMSMGRIHPLRKGWGDSFNRYLLHMVPLILIYFAKNTTTIVPGFQWEKDG